MVDGMPAPPKGMVWVLKLSPRDDKIVLWLYKESWWCKGKSSGWSIKCSSIIDPDSRLFKILTLNADIDKIVKGVVMVAREMIGDVGGDPARKDLARSKAAELSARLGGIKVEVKN